MDDTTTGFSTGHHQNPSPSYPTLPHLPEGNQTHLAGHHRKTSSSSYPTLPHSPEKNQTHIAGHQQTTLPSYPPQPHQVPQGNQTRQAGPGNVPSHPHAVPQGTNNASSYPQQPQGAQGYPTGPAKVSSYQQQQPQMPQQQGYQPHQGSSAQPHHQMPQHGYQAQQASSAQPHHYQMPQQVHQPHQASSVQPQHQVPQGAYYAASSTGMPAFPPQPQVPLGSPFYPQTTVGVPAQSGLWSTGLFDCAEDVPNCCITAWLPCITFGQAAEIIDRGASSCAVTGSLYGLTMVFTGLHFIYSCMYRTKLKQQIGMPQDAFEDFCIHFWCHFCALCQEYRELHRRGLDPAIGWYGNVERMNKGPQVITNPPMVPGGMIR